MTLSPNALLAAVTVFGLGFLALLGLGMLLAWRFMTTVAILRAAPDAKSAAAMLRATGADGQPKPEKVPMEMPATGIDELANSPEAIAKIRKKQNPTPTDPELY